MLNKMEIFVRLGGFHQLMSLLGSIGSLMEGSGLRRGLETVNVPLTVGHMMTGKAYTRAGCALSHDVSICCLIVVLRGILELFNNR